MNCLLVILVVISFIFAAFSGNMSELSSSAVTSAAEAVALVIRLCGGLCFWSGIMRLCEKNGICSLLSRLLSPIIRLVFPSLSESGEAARLISMNISANLLGLGNAATPLGIAAMKKLNELNHQKNVASDDMVSFAVINSSSIQLLPTTLATLRAAYGCTDPMNVLPAVVVTSVLSLAFGLLLARVIPIFKRKRRR